MNLFQETLQKNNTNRPPVWFMRQAGRYHTHYQNLKKKYSFEEICKIPEVACEATMGPITDFNFDAAIVFSDLLFPLEAMGMHLSYNPAPTFKHHIRTVAEIEKLHSGKQEARKLSFQTDALKQIKQKLSPLKGLIGFVGAPFTLYCYAVDGSHQKGLQHATENIPTLFNPFCEKLYALLLQNMLDQSQYIDCLAIMDTAAGEISLEIYRTQVLPWINKICTDFKKESSTPILYYSKNTSFDHWRLLATTPIDGIGIDWHTPIVPVLNEWSERFIIQGNFNPHNLSNLNLDQLTHQLKTFFEPIQKLPSYKRKGWICGLGHGVLKTTPEANVRHFLSFQKEVFN
jgi:uroporphyrinogen decarboxylase